MNKDLEIKKVPNATAVLVLGIVSLVICGIVGLVCAIIALVLHKKDKAIYDTNPGAYEMSFKNSNTGRICATIGLVLSGIMMLISIIYLILFFTIFSSVAAGQANF